MSDDVDSGPEQGAEGAEGASAAAPSGLGVAATPIDQDQGGCNGGAGPAGGDAEGLAAEVADGMERREAARLHRARPASRRRRACHRSASSVISV